MAQQEAVKITLSLTEKERAELKKIADGPKPESTRAHIILLLAKGEGYKFIVKACRTSHSTITKWQQRFIEQRVEGIKDKRKGSAYLALGDNVGIVVTAIQYLVTKEGRWGIDKLQRTLRTRYGVNVPVAVVQRAIIDISRLMNDRTLRR